MMQRFIVDCFLVMGAVLAVGLQIIDLVEAENDIMIDISDFKDS
jgi:hypothetical protein